MNDTERMTWMLRRLRGFAKKYQLDNKIYFDVKIPRRNITRRQIDKTIYRERREARAVAKVGVLP